MIHLVFIRRGNADYTYVDGKLIQSTYSVYNSKQSTPLDMQHNWFIGTALGNNPNYNYGRFNYSFYGLIDELRIYNRALADSEVTALYQQGQVVTPTITSITPTVAAFAQEEVFTIKGTNLVPNLNFSLKNCDQTKEVGTGTATERFFQCTPKNNEGIQSGTVSLPNGKVLKNFSVKVNTHVKSQSVDAELKFVFKNEMSGHFPIGYINGLNDVPAILSSATPWYIKVNGKKIYSGFLGDSFLFKRQYSNENGSTGSALIYLKNNAGKLLFSWDNANAYYKLTGKLPELKAQIKANTSQKITFEFGFDSTKVAFNTRPDDITANTAAWIHDFTIRDDSFYLSQDKIALRKTFLDTYVHNDVESNIQFLNTLNMGTITSNQIATGLAESLDNTLSIIKLSSFMGKEVTKEVKIEVFKKAISLSLSKSLGYMNESQSKAAAKFLEDFTSLAVENEVDFLSGDFTGVVSNFAFYSYKTVVNAYSSFLISGRLEKIYNYRIAEEVLKQLIAHDGSIATLHSSLFPNDAANTRTWRKVIIGIASQMDCDNRLCTFSPLLDDDYNPEAVNDLVQNYLAMMRILADYGRLSMYVTP